MRAAASVINSTTPTNTPGQHNDGHATNTSKDAMFLGIFAGGVVLLVLIGVCIRVCGWWRRKKMEEYANIIPGKTQTKSFYRRILSPLKRHESKQQLTKDDGPDLANLTKEMRIQQELPNIHQLDFNANDSCFLPPMCVETNTECTPAVSASDRSDNSKLSHNKALELMLRANSQTDEKGKDPNRILFRLKFTENCRTLFITVEQLHLADFDCHIPHKANININLHPMYPDGHSIKLTEIMKSRVMINNTFQFRRVCKNDLQRNTLKITVRFGKDAHNPILGEVCIHLCDVDFADNQHISFYETLQPVAKMYSTRSKYLKEGLGQLCLTIKAELLSNRIKVLVRRATNLPKSGKLVGEPSHYVYILLKKGLEEVMSFKTAHKSGCNPTWNTVLLMALDDVEDDVDQLYLEFIVRRTKAGHKDSVIGKVTVGPTGPASGQAQWIDIMSEPALDITKWHELLPVFTYK